MNTLELQQPLSKEHVRLFDTLRKACTESIFRMLHTSQSGHPGGSLSSLDLLLVLYAGIIGQTGAPVFVSNGHISPGVYSVLAEMGYIPKEEVCDSFRQAGSPYEGHVARHIPGVHYGTGPLGIGVTAALGCAIAEKRFGKNRPVFAFMGDGETQEGEVHEMAHIAAKEQLDNFIVIVDDNKVQLTASLAEVMPINIRGMFEAADWHVLSCNGHDTRDIWDTYSKALTNQGKPTIIIAHTIMGQGVDFMEEEGKANRATWHGKAPEKAVIEDYLPKFALNKEEQELLDTFRSTITWTPKQPSVPEDFTKLAHINTGAPRLYTREKTIDCRSAYGNALLDLVHENKEVVALTADLRGSVKTDGVAKTFPEQHIEVGIAEQAMVSVAGGMSLGSHIPFCSTFGAFMTSRAKDQARVNDINRTNVKMVATHCGVSVGEDGPTHQAIDDMTSFLGLYHTHIIEPADPNHCDHIIRYIASHYGNFYVRMGRHKYPILTKEDGSPFYDKDYQFSFGKADLIRKGAEITIITTGACSYEALEALEQLKAEGKGNRATLIVVSSLQALDPMIKSHLEQHKKLITIEDHNVYTGLGAQVLQYCAREQIHIDEYKALGVSAYQLSGTAEDLYKEVGIDAEHIKATIEKMI